MSNQLILTKIIRGCWDLSESISLDCLSLVSESGFRYCVGIHKHGALAKAVVFVDGQPPTSLSPRVCAKVAFFYYMKKSKDLRGNPETKEDFVLVKRERGKFRNTTYDISMKESHATIYIENFLYYLFFFLFNYFINSS